MKDWGKGVLKKVLPLQTSPFPSQRLSAGGEAVRWEFLSGGKAGKFFFKGVFPSQNFTMSFQELYILAEATSPVWESRRKPVAEKREIRQGKRYDFQREPSYGYSYLLL